MAKHEVSVVEFINLVTIGATGMTQWSSRLPEHSIYHGKMSCREVRNERGMTEAVFIRYDAGPVQQEVEVPASNIRSICRLPVKEEPVADKKVGK
jgi:hypothetical protein